MSQTIATLPNEPFHTLRVRLDDQDYTLELRYNTRAENWSLSLYDAEDTLLLAGLKVFTNLPLLRYYRHISALPPGELVAMTVGSDDSAPKLGELGKGLRVELTYFTPAELVAILTSEEIQAL